MKKKMNRSNLLIRLYLSDSPGDHPWYATLHHPYNSIQNGEIQASSQEDFMRQLKTYMETLFDSD